MNSRPTRKRKSEAERLMDDTRKVLKDNELLAVTMNEIDLDGVQALSRQGSEYVRFGSILTRKMKNDEQTRAQNVFNFLSGILAVETPNGAHDVINLTNDSDMSINSGQHDA